MIKKFNILFLFLLCFLIGGCTQPGTNPSDKEPGGNTEPTLDKIYVTN